MKNFVSPAPDKVVLGIANSLLGLALRSESIEVRPTTRCLSAIKNLRGSNCVLMVNHSDRSDPVTVFSLAKQAKEVFYYLSARELFDENWGVRGWVMRHCGAYSVIRGEREDLLSMKKTIEIMSSAGPKLVMFPEGDVTGRDDEILPMKRDGMKNVLLAAERLSLSPSAGPLFALPIATYYQVDPASINVIERALSQLELIFRLDSNRDDLPTRIEAVLHAVIEHWERHYAVNPMGGTSSERLLGLCGEVSSRIANLVGHRSHPPQIEYDATSNVLHSARSFLNCKAGESCLAGCDYCRQLHKEYAGLVKILSLDLDRMQQLLILTTTMQQNPQSIECLWRLVDRLELQVLGKSSNKGVRTVFVDSGEPIDVGQFVGAFQRDANTAVDELSRSVRDAMLFTLLRLKQRTLNVQQQQYSELVASEAR